MTTLMRTNGWNTGKCTSTPTQPVPVLTYFKKLSMFKGVVMVNIYEEQLKQLINTSSQLDRFFILDKDRNFT